ncbi:MAG: formyltetrahydrofolate deformylase [Candidatus Marinimicrobia bacterium]|nr:formyltetrahydrofolate deformylase [Candidatus Neomarinimicrobiota bacterium]
MSKQKLTAILLLSCPDRVGLVSRISHFISEHYGNIIDLFEHVDREEGVFSIRVAWDMDHFSIPASDLKITFATIAEAFHATWDIKFLEERTRVAIFVSKYDHCLLDLLWRNKMGEYCIDIPLIISNHADLKPLSDQYDIPFYHIPVDKHNKAVQEQKELELLAEHQVDTIVLARYMQVLSANIVNKYPDKIINIHHSFLPAFIGSNPYKQAFQRGVKIVGATSHYVTADLDEGPIIEQNVIRISHKDTLKDVIRKGRDLERVVLARALQLHFEHRVLVKGKRTIIFE